MLKWWFSGLILMFMGNVSFSLEKTEIRGKSIDDVFPNLYRVEDYYSCPQEYSFCTVHMKLIPQNDESDIWKQLQSWSVSDFHYNRTIVHRTLCIPSCFSDGSKLKHFAESKINKELEAYNLTTQMLSHDCLIHQGDFFDNFKPHLAAIALHLGLLVVATLYDLYGKVGEKQNIVQRVLLCFSVMQFIRGFTKTYKTKNFGSLDKIKSMEGVRLTCTLSVITAHSIITFTTKPFTNPNEFEQCFEDLISQVMTKFSLVAVQIYFVMSSWLLTRQILSLHSQEGKFTLRHCVLTFTHRIAKIWPPLAYMMFIIGPLFFYYSNGPGSYSIVNNLRVACTSNRLVTFLHITNLFRNFDVCHFGFWSLSLDMQYYLLNIIFLYVILKYKLDIKKGLALLIFITYLIYSFQMYFNNITLSMWMSVKLFGTFDSLNKPELSYLYFGFFVNYTSSLIGTLFGYIDFQTKNVKHPVSHRKIYGLIATGLTFSFLLQSTNYSILATAILIPLLKITFSLGVSMTIYGISRNIIRGPLKLVLEHKVAQILASYSYAVYLFHFIWVLSRGTNSSSPFEFTMLRLAWISIQECIICFVIGVVATVAISVPSVLLENMILPPLHRKKHEKEN